MTGAYCSPTDVYEITHTTKDKDITDEEVYHWIEKAMSEIDSCLAGIYEIPFATKTDPITWETTDEIPPLIRTWCQKLAGSKIIRKLYTARAGKNQSPYGDSLRKEAEMICKRLQEGDANLLDVDGNIIPRLDADATDAATSYSQGDPYPATHVMPDMYDQYPDFTESGSDGS